MCFEQPRVFVTGIMTNDNEGWNDQVNFHSIGSEQLDKELQQELKDFVIQRRRVILQLKF